MPIIWAVQCTNFVYFISMIFCYFPFKYFGQKRTLVIGQVLITVIIFCIVGFNYSENSIMVVVFMALFLVIF